MEGSFKSFENARLLDDTAHGRIKKELDQNGPKEALISSAPFADSAEPEIQGEFFAAHEMTDAPQPFQRRLSRHPHLSRRAMMQKSVETGIAVAASGILGKEEKKEQMQTARELSPSGLKIAVKEASEDIVHPEKRPVVGEFAMGKLAGRAMGDIFADYLGLTKGAKVPEKLFIDFPKVVHNVWERKIDFVERKKPGWTENTQMAQRVYGEFYSQKEKRHFPSMEQYEERIENIIRDTEAALNWEALPALQGFEFGDIDKLTVRDVELIKNLSSKISGTTILAYFLTELMPAREDHEANIAVYEFLLQNAGEELINCSPALYDPYLSVGPGQPTSYAVYDMGGNQVRGASLINRLLPKDKRIPGSVVKLLTTEYQVKAAYLFAIHNLAKLIVNFRKRETERTSERIRTLREASPIAVLQYIASAHHNPGDAIQAFRKWIDRGYAGSHAALAENTINYYIKKSYGGYRELQKQIRS